MQGKEAGKGTKNGAKSKTRKRTDQIKAQSLQPTNKKTTCLTSCTKAINAIIVDDNSNNNERDQQYSTDDANYVFKSLVMV